MVKKIIYVIITISSLLLVFMLFKNSIIIVKGGSMEPTLYNNDLLIVYPKEPSDIKIGEIVVISSAHYYFENGGEPLFSDLENYTKIVHRVIDKIEMNGTWFFLTKGDNNILIDGSIKCLNKSDNYSIFEYNASNGVYIPETAIESVMFFKIPFLGYLQDYSLIILIGNGILVILYFFVKKNSPIFKKKKSERLLKLLKRTNILLFFSIILFLGLITTLTLNEEIFFMNNNSMSPTFYKDDILIGKTIDPENIMVNDVVIIKSPKYYYEQGFDPIFWNFYPNNSYLVHRIVEKKMINSTWFFVTQGDQSQWKPDGIFKTIEKTGNYDYFKFELNKTNRMLITQEAIVGVVQFKIPILGFLIKNYILILGITILFIIFISLKIKTIKNTDLGAK
jgi:signal peptidase I